jgi:hypothetical protein
MLTGEHILPSQLPRQTIPIGLASVSHPECNRKVLGRLVLQVLHMEEVPMNSQFTGSQKNNEEESHAFLLIGIVPYFC